MRCSSSFSLYKHIGKRSSHRSHVFTFQTHPNIDKKLFNQSGVIGLKQGGKGFPVNNEIGVVKWRLQTKNEDMMPLTSKSHF